MPTRLVLRSLLAVVVAFAAAAAGDAADGPSMTVFVAASQAPPRPDVDDATKNALKKKRDEANKARQALEKQLKAQFGKKREEWPDDKDDELYRLEEAAAAAEADYEYRKIDPKEIADAVEDLKRATEGKGLQAGKKDRIVSVASAADAQLVVEVVARRSKKPFAAVVPSDCWVLFTLGPGGKTNAKSFANIPPRYRPRKFFLSAWKIAGPTAEKPVFWFVGWNGGGTAFGCHGAAANSAAGLIDKFIEDNHAVLTK